MKLPSAGYELPVRPFAQNWPLHLLIAGFTLIWVVLFIHPMSWKDWMVENILPVLFVVLLIFTYRRFAFSNRSYLWIAVFLVLHLIGAHYAYKHTVIDIWFKQVFHSERGVFDRIVHFAFGLLLLYPMVEWLWRLLKLRPLWALLTAAAILLACSGLFEIIEMAVSLIASPQLAADYMGLQGDPLDSQKDMLMSWIGAGLSIGWLLWMKHRHHKARIQPE